MSNKAQYVTLIGCAQSAIWLKCFFSLFTFLSPFSSFFFLPQQDHSQVSDLYQHLKRSQEGGKSLNTHTTAQFVKQQGKKSDFLCTSRN